MLLCKIIQSLKILFLAYLPRVYYVLKVRDHTVLRKIYQNKYVPSFTIKKMPPNTSTWMWIPDECEYETSIPLLV